MRCPLALAGLLLAASPALCDTWTVHADGTGDFATIQAALDGSAPGDVIELTDGVYTGPGNRDIWVGGDGKTVRSASGIANNCTLLPQGSPGVTQRAFHIQASGTGFTLENITINGGTALDPNVSTYGGAVLVESNSSPMFRGVVFIGNRAHRGGAVFAFAGSSPDFDGCRFKDNHVTSYGGAIQLNDGCTSTLENCEFLGNRSDYAGGAVTVWHTCTPAFTACTFYGNLASEGGAVWCRWGAAPTFTRCILSYSGSGGAVGCELGNGTPTLSCCNVFGNNGGDWSDCIAGQESGNGNMSVDPLFCDALLGFLELQWGSPCLPAHSGGCGQVGRWGPGNCPSLDLDPRSWGRMKGAYR